MKTGNEIRLVAREPLLAHLAETQRGLDSVRLALPAGQIAMQTTKGIITEPDPLKRGRSLGMNTGNKPARWG